MTPENAIREALHTVVDPLVGKPVDEIGMVGEVEVSGDRARVRLLLPIPDHPNRDQLHERVASALGGVEGISSVEIGFGVMGDEQKETLTNTLHTRNPFTGEGSRTSVIGVSSGKGGVGKSTVTVNLAAALSDLGQNVGVLDADIWGFSVPRMFGLREQRPVAFGGMIMPVQRRGVKVISIGFFVPSEEEPLVWRGPMLHKALEQFLSDVWWGDDLDTLLIDLPPGTGDISISLAGFLPDMGMVIVTTPQPVAQKVAERAAYMSGKVKLRNLGVIENMSGVVCEHCGESTPIFGEGGGRLLSETLDVPLLAQIPLLPRIRELSDAGDPFVWENPEHPATEAYIDAAKQLLGFRPKRRLKIGAE